MELSKELKDFMNAIGAIAEIAGLLRETLVMNGFTREEAVLICSNTVTTMFNPANYNRQKKEE